MHVWFIHHCDWVKALPGGTEWLEADFEACYSRRVVRWDPKPSVSHVFLTYSTKGSGSVSNLRELLLSNAAVDLKKKNFLMN